MEKLTIMMEESKKVDYRFKILYALGIIMVCCGHVEGGYRYPE